MDMDINLLTTWFKENKRPLLWRENSTPYQIWVSEVMLQQTQVSVVQPYFFNWMKLFPTIQELAKAPLSKVLKAWEGLGYYSRARNLHEGARMVCKEFRGIVPEDRDSLLKIKGLGPYTVGAILNFAFKQRIAAVDGNVLRVISRYDIIKEDIDKSITFQKVVSRVESVLPLKEPWVAMEGFIELGALICKKKNPLCEQCPINNGCQAFKTKTQHLYPKRTVRKKVESLYRLVFVFISNKGVFLLKGQSGKVMQDLYEFPYLLLDKKMIGLDGVKGILKEKGWQSSNCSFLPTQKHSFTRYRVTLIPVAINVDSRFTPFEEGVWSSISVAKKELSFSSGHKRILNNL